MSETKQEKYISGYASVFDVRDSQKDVVRRGAFQQTALDFLQGKSIPLLWQHMADKPIGLIEKLEEDGYGLYIVARVLPNIRYGAEALALIKSGSVCSFSIGYTPLKHFIEYESDTRVIEEVNLWEISVVTFPANHYSAITALY